MDVTELGTLLLTGALSGFLVGTMMRDGGFGVIGNIIIGVIGAFIGSWLFVLLRIDDYGGQIRPVIPASIGAVALLLFINLIKKA